VAATASALLFGAGLVIGDRLEVKQSLLVFLAWAHWRMGCGLGYIAPSAPW